MDHSGNDKSPVKRRGFFVIENLSFRLSCDRRKCRREVQGIQIEINGPIIRECKRKVLLNNLSCIEFWSIYGSFTRPRMTYLFLSFRLSCDRRKCRWEEQGTQTKIKSQNFKESEKGVLLDGLSCFEFWSLYGSFTRPILSTSIPTSTEFLQSEAKCSVSTRYRGSRRGQADKFSFVIRWRTRNPYWD